MPQLQIVGQHSHHDDAMIIGTADALRALRDLIDGAIANETAATEFMPSDGEGYTTFVECVSASYMDTCPTSYAFDYGVPHELYGMAVERNKKDADTIAALRAQVAELCGVLRMLRNDTSVSMNQILLINAVMKD